MLPLTSETLFVEIYERKRLNWQRKELAVKKMLFFTFLSMFAFVANIFGEGGWVISDSLTNPLKMLAPLLAAGVDPGGKLALAGVLEAQADEVIAAYAPYIALCVGATQEGWVRLEGEHPAPAVP